VRNPTVHRKRRKTGSSVATYAKENAVDAFRVATFSAYSKVLEHAEAHLNVRILSWPISSRLHLSRHSCAHHSPCHRSLPLLPFIHRSVPPGRSSLSHIPSSKCTSFPVSRLYHPSLHTLIQPSALPLVLHSETSVSWTVSQRRLDFIIFYLPSAQHNAPRYGAISHG
jgi:hypothetical protein